MEHVGHKPAGDTSAFFQAIAGIAIATLVMLGIGATAYHFIAPGGLLGRVFDRSLAGGLAAILALLIIALCVKQVHGLLSIRDRNRYTEIFVYGFAAAGVIYAFHFFVKGGP